MEGSQVRTWVDHDESPGCWARGTRSIVKALTLIAVTVPLVDACGTGAGSSDDHRAAAPDDASAEVGPDGAPLDAVSQDGSVEAGPTTPCAPACSPTQMCCVDAHGHFPRCIEGSICPPPLQPPASG